MPGSIFKFWHNILQYDPGRGSIYTWMLSITRNYCRDFLRSKYSRFQKITVRLDQILDEEIKTSSIDLGAFETKLCLEKLRPEQSDLVNLLFIQGYTREEVSKLKNIPVGTVKTHSRNAIRTLRKPYTLL